ncbi:heparinase II/III domain-containing protein [Paenibacillus eucommiae]|uniref:Heparinase II/III-like C-terminal domain-containing protein n=1 Tax=Paenibacillus eucommiae TaxID=1355755 RepID=A0ABS4IY22_9BACL|nr:heparinase II/III family protein [Paenibacillus eucommiae]MBP1991975.1 hypothetical protein [Paenibacillus eucommiae]
MKGNRIQGSANSWAIVPEVNPSIGLITEASTPTWKQAAVLDQFKTAYYNEPVKESPVYQIGYDPYRLYIVGAISLVEKEALASVEILISPQAYGEAHFVVTLPVSDTGSPPLTDWNLGPNFAKEHSHRTQVIHFTYTTFQENDLFYLEASIPLSSLGSSGIAAGDEWRMNIIHIHHINTLPLCSWFPIRTSSYLDTGNGLVKYIGNVVDQGRLGSLVFHPWMEESQPRAWMPPEWVMSYTSFTKKELSFIGSGLDPATVKLQWKQLSSGWKKIEKYEVLEKEGRLLISFEHPEPLHNGVYQLRLQVDRGDGTASLCSILVFDRESMIRAGDTARNSNPAAASSSSSLPASKDSRIRLASAPASHEVQRVLQMIPDKTGFLFVGLPEMPELNTENLYTLSADGQYMTANWTGTIYPNPLYRENKTLTATNRKGEIIEYPYYEDAAGKKYFITAHLWHLQKERALADTLAVSYIDPLGAARLLHRFIEAYEGYVPTSDYYWNNYPLSIASGPPYNYWGGMWGFWSITDLTFLLPLLQTYAEVKKTNALELLSRELGEDVEQKLAERLLVPSIDYIRSLPPFLGNMVEGNWHGLIHISKLLGQPDYMHDVVESIKAFIEKRFYADGFWNEITPSYHDQSSLALNRSVERVKGWSDPPGYVSSRSGQHFDNLDLSSDPIIGRAAEISKRMVYPNGKYVPIQDTWAAEGPAESHIDNGPTLWPSAGIGMLSIGRGLEQTQLYLSFVPKYGFHYHSDPLSLNLFAKGQELLPDLGYTYTKSNYFTVSAIGHNTVVVDSRDMDLETDQQARDGGRIEAFITADATFQMMRASYNHAFPEMNTYSREPWLVSFPDGDGHEGYVVDLFRVSGGSRHEYTLQGEANLDASFQTEMPLTPYGQYLLPQGVKVEKAATFSEIGSADGHYPGYIYIHDVQLAQTTGQQYALTLETTGDEEDHARLRITGLLEEGENELFLARAPSIRATRVQGREKDNNDEANQYTMPKLVLRREGNDLKSTFVTLLEPYGHAEQPRIDTIEQLQPDVCRDGDVAVKVSYGRTTDIILSSVHHTEQPLIIGDMSLHGEMGFIRLVDGIVKHMCLIGGTLLQLGSRSITGQGAVSGVVTGILRKAKGDLYDCIVTDVPVSKALKQCYVMITHPDQSTKGYKIADILQEAGKTLIVLAEQDPGFELHQDGTSERVCFPQKQWTGTHTFRIANVEWA